MRKGVEKFGSIEFSGKEISLPAVPYDRLAVGDKGELLLVSLVAETQRVKAIRAILCGGARAKITAAGGKIRRPSAPDWDDARQPGDLYPTIDGYNVHTHKLDYGLAHALFVTRQAGFMPVVSEESLWQELNDTRFTTPILREWMPYIEERLREQDLLAEARVFNVRCGILSATTANLDAIVEVGLKEGGIQIPEPSAAAKPIVGLADPDPFGPLDLEYGDKIEVVYEDVPTYDGEFRHYVEDPGPAVFERYAAVSIIDRGAGGVTNVPLRRVRRRT